MTIKSVEKGPDTIMRLVLAASAHPIAFFFVFVLIAFAFSFLPNGVMAKYIEHRTEMKKLDERVNLSRKKLTSGRQNRKR